MQKAVFRGQCSGEETPNHNRNHNHNLHKGSGGRGSGACSPGASLQQSREARDKSGRNPQSEIRSPKSCHLPPTPPTPRIRAVGKQRILLIDDEQHIVDVVVYVLEENAFEVVTALDGETGLRCFKEENPDLVLLDLNLPAITGLDLFREMRKLRPALPVIMLTSRSEEIDRVLGLELGADDYVTKPFSTRELAARVKSVLRRTQRTDTPKTDNRLVHGGTISPHIKA